MGEQAIIPLAADGTFQYYVSSGGSGTLRDFFVSGKIFKPEAPGNFSTGWVNTDGTTAVADGATLTFNHNLGTTNLVFNVYVADDATGTNAFRAGDAQDAGFNTAYGASIQSITSSSFVLQLGSGGAHGGAMTMNSSGDKSFLDYAGKYVKVVASAGGGASVATGASAPALASDGDLWYDENSAALYVYVDSIAGWVQANGGGGGGGTGPRAYVVFDGRSANLTDSITSSFNVSSINDVSTGVYEVNLTYTINNPVLVSSWQGEYRPAYGDVTSSAIKTIALPYDTSTGLGATSTNKIYVGVNQPQNGVPQDRPIHLLVF